jgi:hypothetical protein
MRTKPNFGKTAPWGTQGEESGSCLQMLAMIVGGTIVISAYVDVTSGRGSAWDQYICYGTLIAFAVLMLLGVRDWYRERMAQDAARAAWRTACRSAEVAIVSRRYYPGGSSDDGYDIHYFRPYYRLTLELSADQKAAAPKSTTLDVDVDGIVYRKLETSQRVRIYYKPEAPFTFLLEEEF